jgi:hypothetical protein
MAILPMRFLGVNYDPPCAATAIGSIAGPGCNALHSPAAAGFGAPVILYLPCPLINCLRFYI